MCELWNSALRLAVLKGLHQRPLALGPPEQKAVPSTGDWPFLSAAGVD